MAREDFQEWSSSWRRRITTSALWPMTENRPESQLLETAVNGRADVVVTLNRRHFEPAAAPFGLEILAPADAVRRLENRQ